MQYSSFHAAVLSKVVRSVDFGQRNKLLQVIFKRIINRTTFNQKSFKRLIWLMQSKPVASIEITQPDKLGKNFALCLYKIDCRKICSLGHSQSIWLVQWLPCSRVKYDKSYSIRIPQVYWNSLIAFTWKICIGLMHNCLFIAKIHKFDIVYHIRKVNLWMVWCVACQTNDIGIIEFLVRTSVSVSIFKLNIMALWPIYSVSLMHVVSS